jgi:SET domain-containing protein
MKERLHISEKIEVRKSPLHGYGVFAKEGIQKDETIEECFYLVQPNSNPYNSDYIYRWPQKGKFKYNVISLGYGSIYNSSKLIDERNATWETDDENNVFVFKSVKHIEKGEEILIYYGLKWWDNHEQKYLPKNIK